MRRELRLPLTASGRLDRAVADALGVGRASVKQAFQDGAVKLRGRRARAQKFGWNRDGTPHLGRPIPVSKRQKKPSGEK